jgi:microcystin-dependent protein
MDTPFLAMIILFGGNFAIRGWLFCSGQLLNINQNAALFSLLGTTYGGDGISAFGLPDLRGRVPMGWGQGPGLSNRVLGEAAGRESTTLLITNMPGHNHTADISGLQSTPSASTAAGTTNIPGPALVPAALPKIGSGPGATPVNGYAAKDNTATLAGGTVSGSVTIGIAGGSQPFSIMNPYLALSYLIATEGIFPSRG